jgi:transcriptional regulator of acetoin/glycerol metabolism
MPYLSPPSASRRKGSRRESDVHATLERRLDSQDGARDSVQPRALDNWSCQVIEAATHLAAMILELERATGRLLTGSARRPPDGAAPLIGSSEAIRRVRERIERVAATDFTILIEGAIGPEAHPHFIDVSGQAPLGDRHWEVERAGEDGQSRNLCVARVVAP